MITISISGICGRMGNMIIDCAYEDPDVKVVSGIEVPECPYIGKPLSEITGDDSVKGFLVSDLEKVDEVGDVIIDFSNHEATVPIMEQAVRLNKAMVIGTTGFTETEEKSISELARKIPCVKSPNMSVGVNLLFKLAEQAARALGDSYDIEIVEAHHRFKKDAPSGTARKLLEVVADASGRNVDKDTVFGREGLIGERPTSEIGVFAVRGGDIVGDHTLMFSGLGERIELIHRAHTRATFARGAIRAAKFAAGKEAGLYDMQDVLGMNSQGAER